MKKVFWLISVCLLASVLVLSSCTQSEPEAPAKDETRTTKTAPPTPPSPPTKPSPPAPPSPPTKPSAVPAASDDAWGLWGPLKWPEDYKVTKGANLDFFKKEEVTIDGKSTIIYFLTVAGLRKDKVYHLWLKSLSSPTPTEIAPEVKIDNSGYVIKGQDRFQLGIQTPARGEAMEFALMTADKTSGVFGKTIPYPIESKQGPYRLWVELRSKKGDIFAIYGEGFAPTEEINFTSTSDGETAKWKEKADDKGRLYTIVLPMVVGKESGLSTYSALGKYGEVKVSYEWGIEATKAASPTTQTEILPLPPLDAFMKGMHFTDWKSYNAPPQQRGLYRSPGADQSLINLAGTGANWISLIVSGGQETLASTTIFRDSPATATDSELLRVIDLAHSLGMRVALLPGLGLSNDPDHWGGQIGTAFTSETQWQEWFASYRDYINHYASFAQEAGADMLYIGSELGGVTHREDDWRRIIKEVRERFKGPISYDSLGWGFPASEVKRIKWWDAVDYIAVDVWYPLTDKNDPTVAELKEAWIKRGYAAELESISKQFNRPFIISEIGYQSRDGTNTNPGDFQKFLQAPEDLQEQADCYQAALEVLWEKPWMAGIFWWQWSATGASWPENPQGKPAEEVLKRFYLSP